MSGGSSLYLPLPQCNTDSDSEEELHSGRENHIKNRPKLRNQNVDDIIHPSINELKYKQLGAEGNHNITLRGSWEPNNVLHGVTVLKPVSASPTSPLSPARKVLFVCSLVVCLGTIVGFLWVLPCDLNPCPPAPMHRGAKSWETPLLDFELHGAVAVVRRAVGRGSNLVLLARRSWSAPQPLQHQLVCLHGATGDIVWTHMLAREPLELDCGLLDVNKDGVFDCLVAGGGDLLKAVDPLSGISVWEVGSRVNSSKPLRTRFPLLLPDLTGDGVPDLLTARSYTPVSTAPPFALHSVLLLVSGSNGKMIGSPVPSPFCAGINELLLEKDLSISYTCIDSHNKKSEQTVHLSELLRRAGRPDLAKVSWPRDVELAAAPAGPDLEAHVAGKRLLLENRGRCPDCRVLVLVKDKYNHTLYNRSLENVYGMAPVILSFDRLTGFVLKFWQWHGRKGKRTSNSSETDPAAFTPQPVNYPSSRKRALELFVEVSERVVLITFNDSDAHVVNVSQLNVVQLCRGSSCQPSAPSSTRSLLIADLDDDGSRELVCYSSSYISTGELGERRRLQAQVRVVRLEAELPQLYQAVNQL